MDPARPPAGGRPDDADRSTLGPVQRIARETAARLGLGAEWERPRPDAAALRTDVLVGLALAAVSVPLFEVSRSSGALAAGERSVVEQLLWTVASVLPLTFRRRWPLAAMSVAAGIFLVLGLRDPVIGIQIPVQIALFVALFNGVAWGRDRRATAVVLAVIVLVMTAWLVVLFTRASGVDELLGPMAADEDLGMLSQFTALVLVNAVVNSLYFFGAAVFGQLSWHRALQSAQLLEQAYRLRAQQDEIARRAVVDERLRIARELHDVAAHHVSVIGVQAAAARRVLGVDGEAAGRALSAVELSSREAVGEMRQLLGVLRSDGEPGGDETHDRRPQPGLDTLGDLLHQVQRQGLEVRLVTVGEPRPVPSTVSLSLYRTVQEALVNVRRHSTARSATVTVRWAAPPGSWVEVEVLDDGRPRAATTAGTGLGHRGMRERVELHHGEVEIGPRPTGGFRVRLRLPLDRSAGVEGVAAPQTESEDVRR